MGSGKGAMPCGAKQPDCVAMTSAHVIAHRIGRESGDPRKAIG